MSKKDEFKSFAKAHPELVKSIRSGDANWQQLYEIYDIYKVKPQETQCLSQETNGNVEVTLITCTNDSKYRIIVKARKV